MQIDQVSIRLRKLGAPWTEPTIIRLDNMRQDPSTGEWYARCEIDAVLVQVSVPATPPVEEDA